MIDPVLSPQDRHSAVFLKLKAFYEKRLALLRMENDGNLNELETARKRGRIAEVKAFLALEKDPPPASAEDQNFRD